MSSDLMNIEPKVLDLQKQNDYQLQCLQATNEMSHQDWICIENIYNYVMHNKEESQNSLKIELKWMWDNEENYSTLETVVLGLVTRHKCYVKIWARNRGTEETSLTIGWGEPNMEIAENERGLGGYQFFPAITLPQVTKKLEIYVNE